MRALGNFLRLAICFLMALALFSGCTQARPDYTLFMQHMPKSILVLPPLNNTASIDATDDFLATISVPVGERGYYMFPIAVVDRILRENGVVSPVEMREVSAKKLREIFGADALLDISIEDWGEHYNVIHSANRVAFSYRLVDLRTGAELWTGRASASDESNDSGNGIAGILVGALAHAAASTISKDEIPLARSANMHGLTNNANGLLPGPRAPQDGKPRA